MHFQVVPGNMKPLEFIFERFFSPFLSRPSSSVQMNEERNTEKRIDSESTGHKIHFSLVISVPSISDSEQTKENWNSWYFSRNVHNINNNKIIINGTTALNITQQRQQQQMKRNKFTQNEFEIIIT